MRIPRIPVELDEDTPAPSARLWRRPGVWVLGALAVVVIYLLVRPKEPTHHADRQHNKTEAFIGEVVGYQPPARIVSPAKAQDRPDPPAEPTKPPPPPATPAPPAPPSAPPVEKPALPPAPTMRAMPPPMGGQQQPPPSVHTRMLVYALPPPAATPKESPPDPETSIGFKTATLPGLKASPAIDDTYQLNPGLLPIVLDSAIQSDVPGPFFAHLPGPVYSRKGVLLMEAETQIVGRYEAMGKGSRMQATGIVAHTPNNVWVPLSGQQMGDDLGRAGLAGEVNNHVPQRFAPAVLLTVTDQALQIIQAEASKGGNTYLNLNGGGGGVGSLAQQILQSQINIPPTFTKHQGETMALLLDQPVDFSASYRLQPVRTPK